MDERNTKWNDIKHQILLVIGQCILALEFNEIAIEDTDSPHEQNKK